MAIQFQCPSCSQPIEVDDEYAGQPAACPYCRRVVSVPDRTTLTPAGVVVARPLPREATGDASDAMSAAPGAGASDYAASGAPAGGPAADQAPRGDAPQAPDRPHPASKPGDAGYGPAGTERPAWRNYGTAPPPLPVGSYPVETPPAVVERDRLARQRALTYGTYSMIAGALGLVLMGMMMFQLFQVIGPRYAALATQPGGSPADQLPNAEELEKLVRSAPGAAGRMTAFFYGAGFFSIVGLAFSAASLRSQVNWRGGMGLLFSLPMLLCACGGAITYLLGAGRA